MMGEIVLKFTRICVLFLRFTAQSASSEEMKDIHLYETVVSLRGALNQTSEAQMDALVAELCAE